jgi:hypothetical protein
LFFPEKTNKRPWKHGIQPPDPEFNITLIIGRCRGVMGGSRRGSLFAKRSPNSRIPEWPECWLEPAEIHFSAADFKFNARMDDRGQFDHFEMDRLPQTHSVAQRFVHTAKRFASARDMTTRFTATER